MAPLNLASARVVDPVLTQFARGYSQANLVGRLLFPRASVPVRGFKTIQFGKESFRLYNTRRAPGTATKRIVFGYDGLPAKLNQHALDAVVPREHVGEAAEVPGIDLQQEAVRVVQDVMQLDEEVDQATLATTAANYASSNKESLSGTDQWDDPDSDPKETVKAAKEAVRQKIGRDPNVMLMSKPIFNALDDHPKLLEKTKYTSSDSITVEMLARYFNLSKVAVGDAVYTTGDETGFTDVWGNYVVLAYVPQAGEQSVRVPSYGYTYTLTGNPFVEQTRFDPDTKSWINGVSDERSAELVGAEAGFLISNVLGG